MKRIVLIGGGVAGLCAGIRGQEAGFSCEIVEKQPVAGGNLTGWERDGYRIDNCVHWLTGTKPGGSLNRLWRDTGALPESAEPGVQPGLTRCATLFTSVLDGRQLPFFRDAARTRAAMWEISPTDGAEIDAFYRAVTAMQGGSGFRAATEKVWATLRYARMTLYQLAARFLHPLLRCAMTDYIGGEFSALALIYACAAFSSENGDLPAGGSAAMAARMAERFRAMGGTLRLSAEAERILFADGAAVGVRLTDGDELPADAVVACCDPMVTFGRLAPEIAMPAKLARRYAHPEAYPVYSSVHCAFSADAEAARSALGGTKIVEIRPMMVAGRVVTRLPLREFSHEPSFAPAGETVVQSLLFQRQGECAKWTALRADPASYRAEKARVTAETRERIAERFPTLGKSLAPLDCWTPATYARYFGSPSGAYLSFAWTGRGIPTAISPRVPGVEGLYLATQWQQSPGGLPIAARSGIAAADAVARDLEGYERDERGEVRGNEVRGSEPLFEKSGAKALK